MYVLEKMIELRLAEARQTAARAAVSGSFGAVAGAIVVQASRAVARLCGWLRPVGAGGRRPRRSGAATRA